MNTICCSQRCNSIRCYRAADHARHPETKNFSAPTKHGRWDVKDIEEVVAIYDSNQWGVNRVGGGGGIRTRVRRSIIASSTCLVSSTHLATVRPDEQGIQPRSSSF